MPSQRVYLQSPIELLLVTRLGTYGWLMLFVRPLLLHLAYALKCNYRQQWPQRGQKVKVRNWPQSIVNSYFESENHLISSPVNRNKRDFRHEGRLLIRQTGQQPKVVTNNTSFERSSSKSTVTGIFNYYFFKLSLWTRTISFPHLYC